MSQLANTPSYDSHTQTGEKFEDIKVEDAHLERIPTLGGQPLSVIPGLSGDGPHTGIVISAFAHYTTGQVIRKFWRLYLCGLGAALAGM